MCGLQSRTSIEIALKGSSRGLFNRSQRADRDFENAVIGDLLTLIDISIGIGDIAEELDAIAGVNENTVTVEVERAVARVEGVGATGYKKEAVALESEIAGFAGGLKVALSLQRVDAPRVTPSPTCAGFCPPLYVTRPG